MDRRSKTWEIMENPQCEERTCRRQPNGVVGLSWSQGEKKLNIYIIAGASAK